MFNLLQRDLLIWNSLRASPFLYFFIFISNALINPNILNYLKFVRGVKYFLNGFDKSQVEIKNFIYKCKDSENKDGYLSASERYKQAGIKITLLEQSPKGYYDNK